MTNKLVTISLIDFRKTPRLYHEPGKGKFEIESMKNTIEFKAGSFLKDEQVRDLINKPNWTVNIRQPKEKDYK
jgi:hypothetical protein